MPSEENSSGFLTTVLNLVGSEPTLNPKLMNLEIKLYTRTIRYCTPTPLLLLTFFYRRKAIFNWIIPNLLVWKAT
jgi:hypothetical protein